MRKGDFKDLDTFLSANAGYYGGGADMATFLGSHSFPRPIHFAEDTPLFSSEWDSGASVSWTNLPSQPTSAKPYQRLAVGFTALYTLPGVPIIFYGDEIGLAGGGDPDNRRFMPWSGHSAAQVALRTHLAKLASVRAAHKTLRLGLRKQLWVDSDVYVYSMTLAGEVLLNRSDSASTVKPTLAKPTYTDLLTGLKVSAGSITLPARSSMILH